MSEETKPKIKNVNQSVRITLLPEYGNSFFTGKAEIKTKDGKELQAMQDERTMYKKYDPELPVFGFEFGAQNRVLSIDFRWQAEETEDTKGNTTLKLIGMKAQEEEKTLTFLKNHPRIKLKWGTNPNMHNAKYLLEILEDSTENTHSIFKQKISVTNYFMSKDRKGKNDIAFYFEVNPLEPQYQDENGEALELKMLEGVNGEPAVLMTEKNLPLMIDYMSMNVENFNMKLLIKKAITLGEITHKDGVWYSKLGEPIGMYTDGNSDALVAYCEANESYTNALRSTILGQEFKVDAQGELVKKTKIDYTKDLTTFEEKKAFAKFNKIPHYQIIKSEDKMDDVIKAWKLGQAAKEQVAN